MNVTKFLFHMLFFLALLHCVTATSDEPPAEPSKPKTSVTDFETLKNLVTSLEVGVLGTILIAAGALLAISGKRFFKLFLGIIGFGVGAAAGVIAMGFVSDWFNAQMEDWKVYVVAGILGLIGAAISLYAWKFGVYAAAGLGGYTLMAYILSLKAGGVIENKLGRSTALTVGACGAIVAAMFFEELVIIASSAIIGSLSFVTGLDCFINTGFRAQIYDIAIHQEFNLHELPSSVYWMFAGAAGGAILSAVWQLLSGSSGKGFGRRG